MIHPPKDLFREEDLADRKEYPADAFDAAGTDYCEDFLSPPEMRDGKIFYRYHLLDTPFLYGRDTPQLFEALANIRGPHRIFVNRPDLAFTAMPGSIIPVITFNVKVIIKSQNRMVTVERSKVRLGQAKSFFEGAVDVISDPMSRLGMALRADPLLCKYLERTPYDITKHVLRHFGFVASRYAGDYFLKNGLHGIWRYEDKDGVRLSLRPEIAYRKGELFTGSPARQAAGFANLANFVDRIAGLPPRFFEIENFKRCSERVYAFNTRRAGEDLRNSTPVTVEEKREMLDSLAHEGKESKIYALMQEWKVLPLILFNAAAKHPNQAPFNGRVKIAVLRDYKLASEENLAQINLLLEDGQVLRMRPQHALGMNMTDTKIAVARDFWKHFLGDQKFESPFLWKHETFEKYVAEKKLLRSRFQITPPLPEDVRQLRRLSENGNGVAER